jgi:hypothetical protein
MALGDILSGALNIGTLGLAGKGPLGAGQNTQYANGIPVSTSINPNQDVNNALLGGVFQADDSRTTREAPQAGLTDFRFLGAGAPVADASRSVATPVANANRSLFDTSYSAPGLGVLAGGLVQSNQDRDLQGGNLVRLNAAAEGAVPSAAEKQTQMGLGQVMRNNLALAASQRGTAANQVEAARNALDNNSNAAIQTNAQGAALRAQEQATARQQVTDALTQGRQQDLQGGQLGLGLTGLGVQAGTAQLGADTTTGVANLNKDTTLSTAQLGADTQTGLANLAKNLSMSNAQLDAGSREAIAQLGSDTQTRLTNLQSILNSRQLDDTKKAQWLAASMGIDTRTQEGQIQLQQITANIAQWTQTINAQVGAGNAGAKTQYGAAVLGAGGAVAGKAIGP